MTGLRSFVLALLLAAAAGAAAQDAPAPVESSAWRVTFEGTTDCAECIGGVEFRIGVLDRAGGQMRELPLRSVAEKLTELRLYGNLALVRGDMPYGGDVVAILDLVSGAVLANIAAYGLNIAPDNRYLIYTRWYPRFSDRNEEAAMVYDLALHGAGGSVPPAEPATDGFRFFPRQISFEEHGVENTLMVSTGDGVLWDPARKRAFMTAVDADGYNKLLVLELPDAAITADYPEICLIPFMPLYDAALAVGRRHIVVGIARVGAFIDVDMNDATGKSTDLRIEPAAHCP